MMSRTDEEWRDYVAGRLRASDERHTAQENALRNMRGAMDQFTIGLEQNTVVTNQIKRDTAGILEATAGLHWLGKVAKWFIPVAALIAFIAGAIKK